MRTLWHRMRRASFPACNRLSLAGKILLICLAAGASSASAQDFPLTLRNDGKGSVLSFYHPTPLPLSAQKPASIQQEPAGLEKALYGELRLGPAENPTICGVILADTTNTPARLWVDANSNGDLTDDPPIEWLGQNVPMQDGETRLRYNGKFVVNVRLGAEKVPLPYQAYRFERKDAKTKTNEWVFCFYRNFARVGEITLGAKRYKVWVSDESNRADFSCPADSKRKDMLLAIDVNGNGRVDHDLEQFKLGMPFNIGGVSYVANSPNASGEILHLERSAVEVAELKSQARGDKALSFTARTLTGESVDFPAGYKGKLVLLDFWATWCAPCLAEMPNIIAAYEQFESQGFTVLGVSLDDKKTPEELQQFLTAKGMKWPQIYEHGGWETRLAKQFSVRSIPKPLLVDGTTGMILADAENLHGREIARCIERALENKATGGKPAIVVAKAPKSVATKAPKSVSAGTRAAVAASTPPAVAASQPVPSSPEKSPADSGPEKAPAFTARTMSGREVNFPSGYKGKLVLLEFWATWCAPSHAEMPQVADVYQQYSGRGFEVLGVSLDTTKTTNEVQAFVQDNRMNWEQIYEGGGWDTRLASLFTVRSVPKALLVDGDTGAIIASGADLRGSTLAQTVEQALQTKRGK